MTQTTTAPGVAAASPGPRATLTVLRVLAVLHTAGAIVQPMLAGVYLGGDVDALAIHELNAHVVTGLGFFQLVAAIVFVWRGRGRFWPLWASLAICLAVQAQVGMGYEGVVAVHLPLGVSIIAMQILLTVWLFRAAARTARRLR
ncbi:MAG: hypothetical protein GEU94_16420 [Micromonosporaceae bacterium]|nr:hypothetical protein [Micromonosporaceae bacterium]